MQTPLTVSDQIHGSSSISSPLTWEEPLVLSPSVFNKKDMALREPAKDRCSSLTIVAIHLSSNLSISATVCEEEV